MLLESKRRGNLAWESYFFGGGGGGEGVNFCPGIFGGFVGNPWDFLGFDFCPHSFIECFEKRKGEDGKK